MYLTLKMDNGYNLEIRVQVDSYNPGFRGDYETPPDYPEFTGKVYAEFESSEEDYKDKDISHELTETEWARLTLQVHNYFQDLKYQQMQDRDNGDGD